MSCYGEQGYKKRVGSMGAFRSEGLVHKAQMRKVGGDLRFAGLSELENETLNRVESNGINAYESSLELSTEEYLVQEYIKRMEMENEEPDLLVIKGLRGELD